MIKRILVPLDGSELSERAVPLAGELATALGAVIVLLGVASPPVGRWGGLFRSVTEFTPEMPESEGDLDRAMHPVSKDSQMASIQADVMRKLMPSADRLREMGIEVSVEVGFGHPVDGILQHIHENQIDLVVMSTHGHSGLHPYAYGSTSDRVARHSLVPVTLVRPEEVNHMLPLPRFLGGG